MHTSEIEVRQAAAQTVAVGEDSLSVDLADGRTISHWRLIGTGEGIHWPDLD